MFMFVIANFTFEVYIFITFFFSRRSSLAGRYARRQLLQVSLTQRLVI